MALLDISDITQALMTTIGNAFTPSSGWGGGPAPTVFPSPPAYLSETGIGMYLYHISEDPHYKNLPAPGSDNVPIRFTPMGLKLYYHLSANDTNIAEESRALNEQRMMGVAVKTLRDNPVINVNSNNSDNRLRICLNTIPPNEAVSFWTAGNSEMKLSCYYEVSVALLEPEQAQRRSNRVLSYGVHAFVQGAPRIISSENVVNFVPPGAVISEQLRTSPAQVPIGQTFRLIGTGFNGGSLQLLLHSPNRGPVLQATPAWALVASEGRLEARVQTTAVEQGNPGNTIDIIPGVYGAQVSAVKQRMMPNGQVRNFTHLSNQCPIAIAPSITGILLEDVAQRRFQITGQSFDAPAEQVSVYILDERLINILPDGSNTDYNNLAVGEFAVNPVDPTQLRLVLPASASSGDDLPLRIFVNGIESPPTWLQVP
ncbi:MAG: DUF4255 domain-containing protein [Bacteroidota bacterium]